MNARMLPALALMLAAAAAPAATDNYGEPLPDGAVQRLGTLKMRYGIVDLDYLADGEHALVATGAGIDIWNLPRGEKVETHKLPFAPVTLDMSDDRSRALLSDRTGALHEWDVAQDKVVNSVKPVPAKGSPSGFNVAVYSSDGKRALTLSNARDVVEEWQVSDGKLLHTVALTPGSSYSDLIYGPDGTTAFAACAPHPDVEHYDLASGKMIARFLDDYRAPDIDLSPDGKRLLAGSRHQASEWDVATHKQIHVIGRMVQSGYEVPELAYVGNDRIVTGSRDGSLRLWTLKPLEIVRRWFPHQVWVQYIRISPDNKWALTYGRDGLINETSIETGKPRLDWARHGAPVNAVAATSDGSLVVTGSSDGTLRVWYGADGKPVHSFENPGTEAHALAVDQAGENVAVGSKDGTIRVLSLANGSLQATLEGHKGYINDVAYLPGGDGVSAADDGTIKHWSADGVLLRTLGGDLGNGHRGGVLAVRPVGDSHVLSGGRDGTLRFWDLASGKELASVIAHAGEVSVIAFDEKTGRILTAGADRSVVEWELEGLKLVKEHPLKSIVGALAFLPGGGFAAGDATGKVMVFKAGADAPAVLDGHDGAINSLFVTGDKLYSASDDTTTLAWSLPAGQ